MEDGEDVHSHSNVELQTEKIEMIPDFAVSVTWWDQDAPEMIEACRNRNLDSVDRWLSKPKYKGTNSVF